MRASAGLFVAAMAALLCFASPARAQQDSIEAATARVIINALAPTSYGDWAYDWGPVSSRISGNMHWHVYEPDPRDRPSDAIVRRNGWIDGEREDVSVAIFGGDRRVTELSFRFQRERDASVLLAALRDAGAEVRAEPVTQRGSDYTLALRDRDAATLRHNVSCTSPRSAAAQRCWTTLTLALPPRSE